MNTPKILVLLCCALLLPCSALGMSSNPQEEPASDAGSHTKKRVEVAFVLDTTGSMTGLINAAKKKIWAIANTVTEQSPDAEIYMGLVAYRDTDDEYVTKSFPLTTDIQGIYAELLKLYTSGGGDYPESVNEALHVTVTGLGWTDASSIKADRILFLVGDAPPHMNYHHDRDYHEVVAEAVQKSIIVNTVQCGVHAETTRVWREIAGLGKGEYLNIPPDGGQVIVVETPYDVLIQNVQIQLNATVVPYGSAAQQSEVSGKQKMNRASGEASADMAKFVNKSSKGSAVVTGRGDLVADVKNGKVRLADIKTSELPVLLRDMSENDRETFVEKQAVEREKLAEELAENVKKRDEFIKRAEFESAAAAERAPKGDSFDRSVVKTLEKQLAK